MSGKKAKENRKAEAVKGPPKPEPKVVGQMTINLCDDESVFVFPIPQHAMYANMKMLQAQEFVNKHFLELAMKGKLEKDFSVKKGSIPKPPEKSRIIMPGGEDNIIVPGVVVE